MKKTYMNPSMKVRDMKVKNHFLMASPGLTGTYSSGGTILSRDADMDDWDEEEDW